MARADTGELFETVADGVVVHDLDGEIVTVNDACRELVGYDDGDLRGMDLSELAAGEAYASPDDPRVRRARAGETVRFDWRIETRAGEEVPVEVVLAVTTREGREIGVASLRTTVDRNLDRERYRTLFESDQLILWEHDFSEAREYATDIAEEVDDFTGYLEDNPDELRRIFEKVDVLDVNGNTLDFYGAESKAELVENLDQTLTESSIAGMSQLWEHVVEGDTTFRRECEAQTFDGEIRYELLEMNVPESRADDYSRVYTTTVDITERKRRERELAAAHDARRALQGALADSASAEAFAEAVCAELTALDDVAFARVGTLADDDAVERLAEAGDPVRSEDLTVPDADGQPPEAVAVRRGQTHRERIADGGARAHDPGAGGHEVVAVPIDQGEVTQGALVAQLTDERVVADDQLRELLEESADVLGYALGSERRRRALAADDQVESTVEVDTRDTPLSRAAAATGTSATVTAAIPQEDGAVLCYLDVEGDAGAFVDAARETEGLESVNHVGDRGTSDVQVVAPAPVPTAVVAAHGGIVDDSTVDGTTTALRVRAPRETGFDPVLDALTTRFGGVTTTDYTSEPIRDGSPENPLAALTGRQREVLEAALRAGYFERPRVQSGTEIADHLGVSQQGFQQVLRAAERNLVSAVFDERD